MTRRKISPAFKITLFVLLFLILGGSSYVGLTWGRYYLGTATQSDTTVLIPTGSDFNALMDSLVQADVLTDASYFRKVAGLKSLDRSVRPGRYVLTSGMKYSTLINTLRSGRQVPVKVTFNNLRNLSGLAGVVSRRLESDSLTFLHVFRNDSVIRSYGYTEPTFMAMFIPNTYEFYWTTTPTEFMERMKRESERFWTDERVAKLKRSGLSQIETITLASIVYEETKLSSEMPRVAGVYINRLRIGMLLQADPTVKFAVGDFTLKRVLNRHLEVSSPYNTYRTAGLPPGPICMPSITAIDAVLNFEEHKYLYFCAKADLSGAHSFATNLSDHNRNAQAYVQAINRLGIR